METSAPHCGRGACGHCRHHSSEVLVGINYVVLVFEKSSASGPHRICLHLVVAYFQRATILLILFLNFERVALGRSVLGMVPRGSVPFRCPVLLLCFDCFVIVH